MTRDYMINRSWKPYMLVDLKTKNMTRSVTCMLSSIDFENEVCTLLLFPEDAVDENDRFINVSIDHITVTRPKPTLVK